VNFKWPFLRSNGWKADGIQMINNTIIKPHECGFWGSRNTQVKGNISVRILKWFWRGIFAQISQIRSLYIGNRWSRAWDKVYSTKKITKTSQIFFIFWVWPTSYYTMTVQTKSKSCLKMFEILRAMLVKFAFQRRSHRVQIVERQVWIYKISRPQQKVEQRSVCWPWTSCSLVLFRLEEHLPLF
jgi:hypothetical protein